MKHMSACSAASSCATDAITKLVLDFRRSLSCLRMNNRLTASTPTHPEPPNQSGLRFTFDQADLVQALDRVDTRFVVHHGAALTRPDVSMVKLLDEHLMPFLPKARGLFHLSRSALADVLAYRIRNWSQLGRRAGAIRLLGHGGWINDRVLNACIKRNFGATIAAPLELFSSYEELAEAAEASDDCIAFGLRPAYVEPERLVPALIGGVRPWAAGEGCGVPQMPILLGWRTGSEAPHREIADYLNCVAGNLTADALVTSKLGRSDEHRARRSNQEAASQSYGL